MGLRKARRLTKEPSLSKNLIQQTEPGGMTSTPPDDSWLYTLVSITNICLSNCRVHGPRFQKTNGWSIQKHNGFHVGQTAWLRQKAALLVSQNNDSKRRILVTTHHAPRVGGTSRPEHASNPWIPTFATDLLGAEQWDDVNFWVFGHTHYSTNQLRKDITVVANQRGYVLPDSVTQGERMRRDAHKFDPAMFMKMQDWEHDRKKLFIKFRD